MVSPGSAEPDQLRHPLPRLTSRVFTDLAVWMVGLGVLTGLAFPLFVILLGVPGRYVLSPLFFVATIGAGVMVGTCNHLLSRAVVGSRLRFMRSRMSRVEQNLRVSTFGDGPSTCTPENCSIPVDSDDELGASAASFNLLVDALAASHRVLEASGRFAATLSSHLELVPLAEAALAELVATDGVAAAAICIVEDDTMRTLASTGLADSGALADSDLVRRTHRGGHVIRVEVPDDLPIDGAVVQFRPSTVLALPLRLRSVPLGVLLVVSSTEVSPDDERLHSQLAPTLAVALNNALSHERLQRVAAHDMLTGLHNRRFGLERLDEEFARAVRAREPLGVILFDVDHFKTVNDTHGHHVGDRVLRAVADSAAGVLREGDTLMRYGGEEFLAVMPGAGTEDLRHLGERIRCAVASQSVELDQRRVTVSVSLGAAGIPAADVASVEDLVRHADEAMYVAKSNGRDTLVLSAV